jgi:hypothetical protein
MHGKRRARDPEACQKKRKHAAKMAARTHCLTLAHSSGAHMLLGCRVIGGHRI